MLKYKKCAMVMGFILFLFCLQCAPVRNERPLDAINEIPSQPIRNTSSAFAVEIHVQGEGSAEITPDVAEVQYKAKREATNKALIMALQRILEPEVLKDQRVKDKFNQVSSQLNVYKIKQSYNARKESNKYIVTTELILDETKLRQLLSDMGIALRTNVARANAILTIMDEFFTKPSDLALPLKESFLYRYDMDHKYKEDETHSGKDSESKTSSNKDQRSLSVSAKDQSSGSISAKQQGSASAYSRVSDDYGEKGSGKLSQKGSFEADYAGKTSLNLKANMKSSEDSTNTRKSSYDDKHFIDASKNEHEFLEKIKEYQPRSVPDKQNYALGHLQSAFQNYDLRIVDNDLFRSRYFGDKVITIDELNRTSNLNNYVKFARTEAKADFFGIGISVIVDNGKDTNTGFYTCDGVLTFKVYSTLDAETISSGAVAESAAGNSPDGCRGNVAHKIGEGLGNIISYKIQEYWKKRQIYGSEYVVIITGRFPPMARIQFANSVKQIQGVTNVKPRRTDDAELEFIVSYSGTDPLADSIFMHLASSPLASTFSNYDYRVDGNQINLSPISEKTNLKR